MFLLLFLVVTVVTAQSEDKYSVLKEKWCGDENCYDVLGVAPDSNRTVVKAAYNNLSFALHPDKNPNQTQEDKAKYLKITQAYEILSVSDKRFQYDEYLRLKTSWDSPREHPIVVFLLLYIVIVCIVLQYQKQRYHVVRKAILDDKRVQRYFTQTKNIDFTKKKEKKPKKPKNKKKSDDGNDENGSNKNEKSEIDLITAEEINTALQSVNVIFVDWNPEKPSWKKAALDVPNFFLFCTQQLVFHMRWYYKYNITKQSLSLSDAEYLCRKYHNKTQQEWDLMDSKSKEELLKKGKSAWKKAFAENQSSKKED